MLRLPSYLQKRSDTYYLRIEIPRTVRPYWPGREFKRSLNTPDRAQAIRIARALLVILEGLFEAVSMGALNYGEAKTLLENYMESQLGRFTRALERQGPLKIEQKISLKKNLKIARNTTSWDMFTEYGWKVAERLVEQHQLPIKPDTLDFQRLAVASTHMSVDLMKSYLALNEALTQFRMPSRPTSIPTSAAPETAESTSLSLSQVMEAYTTEKRREGSWTPKTEDSIRGMFNLLLKILGDVPVSQLNAASARRYKDILQRLPANMEKNPAYRGLSIPDVLAQKPKNLISITTLNNNVTKIASLFNWAERNGYIDRNYFARLTLRNPQRADEARAAFTQEDLQKIFSTKQYREHKYLHPHYYWLPLLGLHTGARIGELCQLDLDDIHQEQGIWVIDINDRGDHKQVKTKAARRLIPVHPKLIDLGLLEFVAEQRKRGHTRLFPELPIRRDGASQSASLWFGRYRKKLGFYNQTPKKDFHSFRTTLINLLKQKGSPEPEVATLVGHAIESMTFGRYGKPYTPDVLINMLKKVDFADVLQHVEKWSC